LADLIDKEEIPSDLVPWMVPDCSPVPIAGGLKVEREWEAGSARSLPVVIFLRRAYFSHPLLLS
jgi:hypothetical protein